MVRIAEQNALAVARTAGGEANAVRLRAEGQAAATRVNGDGEAAAIRAVGAAKAEAYRQGIDAVGESGYTAMQMASILGENHVKLVPDIAVSGEGGGRTGQRDDREDAQQRRRQRDWRRWDESVTNEVGCLYAELCQKGHPTSCEPLQYAHEATVDLRPAARPGAALRFARSSSARQLPPYGGAKEFVADLGARRAKAMATLGPETVLVMWSAPTRVYSTDVDYEYRQESNLLYLTGLEQEDSILVLIPGAKSKREWLFTRDYDPRRELWNGHTLTPAEVTQQTGIANVMSLGAFDGFMTALLAGTTPTATPAIAADDFGAFFDAVKQSKARLASTERVGGGPARGNAGPPAPPDPRLERRVARRPCSENTRP